MKKNKELINERNILNKSFYKVNRRLVLERFKNDELEILKEKFPNLIKIISNYFYENETIENTINLLKDRNSKESVALKKLVGIYTSTERIIRKRDKKRDYNLPIFKNISLNPNSRSIDQYLQGFKGRRVLIKPNLVSKEDYPETSSLYTISKILDILLEQEAIVIIGDGPSLFFDSNYTIDKIRRQFPNIEILDFNEAGYNVCTKKSWKVLSKIEIPNEIYKIDNIINLCNFKQHNSFFYSGARKNLMGLISPASRLMIHKLDKETKDTALQELSEIFEPHIIVMDARKIMGIAQQRVYGGIILDGPGLFYSDNPKELDKKMINYLETKVENV